MEIEEIDQDLGAGIELCARLKGPEFPDETRWDRARGRHRPAVAGAGSAGGVRRGGYGPPSRGVRGGAPGEKCKNRVSKRNLGAKKRVPHGWIRGVQIGEGSKRGPFAMQQALIRGTGMGHRTQRVHERPLTRMNKIDLASFLSFLFLSSSLLLSPPFYTNAWS